VLCQFVPNFLSYVSAKYHLNWFIAGKVITKIKKGELFIETQCRYFNTDREFGYLNLQCKTNFRGLRLAAFESPLTSAGKTVNNHLCIDSPGGAFHIILYLNR